MISMEKLKTSKNKLIILFFFSISSIGSLYSENIRGRIAGTLQIDEPAVEFKPEEQVIIKSDKPSAFQEGIEIQVIVPSLLRDFRNSFALMIYKDISPDPNENLNEYSGTKIHMELIPARERVFVRIPFNKTDEITGDALTSVLSIPVNSEQFPLLLSVLSIMKGIPDVAFSEKFIISAVPIWKNEGSLTVTTTNSSGDSEEIIEVSVDRTSIGLNKTVRLPAGIHKVRIASTHAPVIEETITLEPGEEKTLDFELDYKLPELTIHIPQGAITRLDGELIDFDETVKVIEVYPGDHLISYTLGELEVSRNFTVQPGSELTISLFADVEITERGGSGESEYIKDDG